MINSEDIKESINYFPEKLKKMIIDNNYEIDNIYCSFKRGLYDTFINPINLNDSPSAYYAYPLIHLLMNLENMGIPVENQVFSIFHNVPNWINFIVIDENKIIDYNNKDIEYYFCKLLGIIIKEEKLNEPIITDTQKNLIEYLTCNNKFNFNKLDPFDYKYFDKLSDYRYYNYLDGYEEICENFDIDFNDMDYLVSDISKLYHIILCLSLIKYKNKKRNNIEYSYEYNYYISEIFRKLEISGILTDINNNFINFDNSDENQLLVLFDDKSILNSVNIEKYKFNGNFDDNIIYSYNEQDELSKFTILYNLISNKDFERLNNIIHYIKSEDLVLEDLMIMSVLSIAIGLNFEDAVYLIYDNIEPHIQLFNYYDIVASIENDNFKLFKFMITTNDPNAIPYDEILEYLIIMNKEEHIKYLMNFYIVSNSVYNNCKKLTKNSQILNLIKNNEI